MGRKTIDKTGEERLNKFGSKMTIKELEIHNKKKELLRMLSDIHREIVFNNLEDEGFRNMLRESLRVMIEKI